MNGPPALNIPHNSGIICKPIITLGKMLQKSKMDDYDHQCHQGSKVFASVATWTEELNFFYKSIAQFMHRKMVFFCLFLNPNIFFLQFKF